MAVAMSADSPNSLNRGKTTGTNSTGTRMSATLPTRMPMTTSNRSRDLLRSMISSRRLPSPMALPTMTAVASPRPKHTTRNSRLRLPMTALAASISTELSV